MEKRMQEERTNAKNEINTIKKQLEDEQKKLKAERDARIKADEKCSTIQEQCDKRAKENQINQTEINDLKTKLQTE